jgi:hypothetical protein
VRIEAAQHRWQRTVVDRGVGADRIGRLRLHQSVNLGELSYRLFEIVRSRRLKQQGHGREATSLEDSLSKSPT